MRACIPIAFKPEGGGQYFLQAFRAHLEAAGHSVTARVADRYDVLFTNHWLVPLRTILRGIRHNPHLRIVQRIDGSATDYGRFGDADQRQHEVNALADLTIFQSRYCRWSTREKFPVIAQDGPVIHNPVDLRRFTPEGPTMDPIGGPEATRIAAVSWSTNPKKGAASVYEVARRHPEVAFYLCGRFPYAPALPNLHALGVLDRDRLPVVLRSCHALLTFSENEACPNHVLEGLAAGLPILYADSGATREVVADCGLDVTIATFGRRLEQLASDWAAWAARSRRRAIEQFDPEVIFARYITEIEGARARPPRVPGRTRFVWALGGPAAAWWLGRRRWDEVGPRTEAAS